MNYVGSIPHWVYATELRHHREAWRELMWWLSLLATIGAATGVVIGRHTPRQRLDYQGLQHWHHIFGLIFAPFLLAGFFLAFCRWRITGRCAAFIRSTSLLSHRVRCCGRS